ncbi:hypothetical protein Athai_28960 [Actinocatenispora thailandica]|uniref:Uncharacterized protein n=1 Tax=Actinocatenispora thailandica TaxID=227318 RepID=A0A7R7HXQ7_9ACTN|nr:hypothetical protein [Actinocatenispora thailandica]BCJ35393.1 hypothetical protein Athai_28960 [Actinocatenispora thailandica]
MSILALREDQYDQVAWLTIVRFGRHAEFWASRPGPGESLTEVAELLRPMTNRPGDVGDPVLAGRLAHEALRMMNGFGEEPTGASYYPFKTAELLAMSAEFLLGSPRNTKAFALLVEWLDRFARHLDWQMKTSRIWPDRPGQFTSDEEDLRRAFARLTGSDGKAYAESWRDMSELADLQLWALRCSLSRESRCDFVVIADITAEHLPRADLSGVRITATKRPVIYFHTNADHFDRQDRPSLFIHVWDRDPDVVCRIVEVLGSRARWVDVRDPSGALIEAARYREVRTPSFDRWR